MKFLKVKRILGQWLHKRRPVNRLHPYFKSRKVDRFRNKVLKALRDQRKAMPEHTIKEAFESISKVSQEDIRRVRAIIDRDYGSFGKFLTTTDITNYISDVYNDGADNTMDNLGIEGVFDLQNQGVIDLLRDRANYVIKSVDDTTKADLAETISKGVEQGLDWQTVAQQIADNFDGISSYRAELISRMETGHAYNQATADFFDKNGITTKVWITDANPCEICQENADAGSIAMDDTFPSGDNEPEAHVNCLCVLDTTEELPVDYEPEWLGN
jgi:SPP1 gp7 family putative phage head morphogenesis protein